MASIWAMIAKGKQKQASRETTVSDVRGCFWGRQGAPSLWTPVPKHLKQAGCRISCGTDLRHWPCMYRKTDKSRQAAPPCIALSLSAFECGFVRLLRFRRLSKQLQFVRQWMFQRGVLQKMGIQFRVNAPCSCFQMVFFLSTKHTSKAKVAFQREERCSRDAGKRMNLKNRRLLDVSKARGKEGSGTKMEILQKLP